MAALRYGGTATTAGIWILVAIIGFFLLTEHRAHVFGILPWLFLLACPAMHLLMHRGHRHHAVSDRQATVNAGDCHGGHPRGTAPDATEAGTGRGGVS